MTEFLKLDVRAGTCAVTYRANTAGGEEVEIRLHLDPAAATLADAWTRLSGRYERIDPRSIEIELRELPASMERLPKLTQIYA